MEALIKWIDPNPGGDKKALPHRRVLYAYLHPLTRKILYIGKADFQSVSERTRGAHKEKLHAHIAGAEGIESVHLIIGLLHIEEDRKFSSALLSDVESLLIVQLQPRFNTQSRATRISRPGLVLNCRGDCWPIAMRRFVDS